MKLETKMLHIEDGQEAESYIESVRDHYRRDHGEYRGRRNPDQQLIAEVTADEARLIVDGAMAGILALGRQELPADYDTEVTFGGFKWSDFKNEFERLLVGFGVITDRLNRDGYGVESYSELPEKERLRVATQLFQDFLDHNALRFGAEGVGIEKTDIKVIDTDDGGIERTFTTRDKDVARTPQEHERNVRERGYSTGVAAHVAGKISVETYKKLRREFSQIDKDKFDYAASFYKNFESYLESIE